MKNYGLTLLIKFFWHTISPFNDKDFHYRVKNILLILCFIFFFGAIQIFNRFFLFLDNLLFPKFKNIKIDSPFFIWAFQEVAPLFFIKIYHLIRKILQHVVFKKWFLLHQLFKNYFKTLLRFDIIIGSPIQKW